MDNLQFTMDNLQWTMDNGQWTIYSIPKLSIVHCPLEIISLSFLD